MIVYGVHKIGGNDNSLNSLNVMVNYHYNGEKSLIAWLFPSMTRGRRPGGLTCINLTMVTPSGTISAPDANIYIPKINPDLISLWCRHPMVDRAVVPEGDSWGGSRSPTSRAVAPPWYRTFLPPTPLYL